MNSIHNPFTGYNRMSRFKKKIKIKLETYDKLHRTQTRCTKKSIKWYCNTATI